MPVISDQVLDSTSASLAAELGLARHLTGSIHKFG